MADLNISDLTAGAALTGAELFETEVPGSPAASRKHTAAQIAAYVSSVLGRQGFRYTIDLDSTADSDPTAGLLKFDNASIPSATFIYIDDETTDGADLSTYFGTLGATGFVRIVAENDPGVWALFAWSALTDGTGYWKLAVTYHAGAGAFSDADAVLVIFDSDENTGEGNVTGLSIGTALDLFNVPTFL
jgi:hypothetical protein